MNRPLRGALVGYGFIAEKGHTPEYLRLIEAKEIEIVAVADICRTDDKSRCGHFLVSASTRVTKRCSMPSTILSFVDITAPPYVHAEIAHRALDHGLHVLCEKPLTVSGSEARSLAEHAQRVSRVLFPCHNYRHAPVVKAVRQVLATGEIGVVNLVTLQTFWHHPCSRRRRVAARLAPRSPLLGRRHCDGPRQSHLLPRVRVVARVSDVGDREGKRAPCPRHRRQLQLYADISNRYRNGAPYVDCRCSQSALHTSR